MERIAVYRKEHFNSAHRLHNPNLSEEENAMLFGKCNYPNYHGHNYEVIVKLVGEIDPKTGYIFDMKILSDLIQKHVVEKFDHKNLNLDVPEFKNTIPTAENIVKLIYNILREKIDKQYELRVTLYETERNYVKYPA